jgi:hypothetical protein
MHAEDKDHDFLPLALIDHLADGCEEHACRLSVTEKLFPIIERKNASDLAQTAREIFECRFRI